VLEEAQEKAWEQIRGFLQRANRVELQTLLVELLLAMGYHVAWIAPPEKDRGHIDLVVNVDPLGAKGPRIYVQLRQKGQPMTVEGLKPFLSALGPENHGLLVSTGGFTGELLERVQADASLKITLLDLEGFFDLWVKYYQQLSQEAHLRLPLKAVYFLNVAS
jgi:restriction system protein